MSDAGVKTMFENKMYKIVQGAMVLPRGVKLWTLYKILRRTISDGCNNPFVPHNGIEEGKNPIVFRNKTMLWNKKLGHARTKGLQALHGKAMVECMYNYSLYFDLYENFLYKKHY